MKLLHCCVYVTATTAEVDLGTCQISMMNFFTHKAASYMFERVLNTPLDSDE